MAKILIVDDKETNLCLSGKDRVRIDIRDEGIGFDMSALKPGGDPGAGFGLFSICERIGLIGGHLRIDSAPGRGSRFSLFVPKTPENKVRPGIKNDPDMDKNASAGALLAAMR
jgi:signal transduction histidine kinase